MSANDGAKADARPVLSARSALSGELVRGLVRERFAEPGTGGLRIRSGRARPSRAYSPRSS